MPFYIGNTADGSGMREWEGVYVNPDNPNEWSSRPYPAQIREANMYWEVRDYMSGRYTIEDVFNQIKNKNCGLSRRLRDYVSSLFDENGNYIEDK